MIVAFLVLLQRYEVCNMCCLWPRFWWSNQHTAKEHGIFLDICNGLDRRFLGLIALVGLVSSLVTIETWPVCQFNLGLSTLRRSVAFPIAVGAQHVTAPPG